MRNVQIKKGISFWISIISVFVILSSIEACKSKTKAKPESFDMFCRQLTKDDIQAKWVDNGWTRTGNANFISLLRFKTNKIGAKIQMEVDAVKASTDIVPSSTISLKQETSCYGTLPDNTNYVDNYADLTAVNIVPDPANGNLSDFTYIRLTPVQDTPPYLNFHGDVIKKNADGTETILSSFVTYPCPPHCPKPSEDAKQKQ